MALGRKSSPVVATEGYAGRLSVPPQGGLYVRNPTTARSSAIKRQLAALTQSGEEVPQHLRDLATGLESEADEVELVDAATGTLLGEVEVVNDPPVHRSATFHSDRVTAEIEAAKEEAPVAEQEKPKPEEKVEEKVEEKKLASGGPVVEPVTESVGFAGTSALTVVPEVTEQPAPIKRAGPRRGSRGAAGST
jgi:hypothetical protein